MANTTSPLVSIITPTYNHEKFIRACMDSVLGQSYSNWEQIVLDDGSTDRTAEIVRSYKDPRIRYCHQPNSGIEELAHTYNRALAACNGELVAILEGDDAWPSGKLSSLVPVFCDPKVVLAYGAVADVAQDGTWHGRLGRSVRNRMRLSKHILCNDPIGSATRYLLRADGVDLVPPSTVVIRRTALEAIGGFQYSPGLCVTDFPTVIKLSLIGNFHYTPNVMGFRRRHNGSATFNNLAQILSHAQQFVEHFLNLDELPLSNTERSSIEATWHDSYARLAFTEGRIKLARREWSAARAHFIQALRRPTPRTTLAALAGWLISWLRCDLEKLLALIGVAHLEPRG